LKPRQLGAAMENKTMKRILISWLGLAALGLLLVESSAARAQQSFTKVSEQVNKKMVKLFGSGGFKGLPSYGTGVLVSADGFILTVNNHMLNTPDLRAHLYDGRVFQAKVIAKEPEFDIALIKIDAEVSGLQHYDFTKSAVAPMAQPGDWILAFSNQFRIAEYDEPLSIMRGNISAITDLRGRRGVSEAPFHGEVYFLDCIACNPGSAGGIITTRKGELLGIIGRELKNTLSDTWINYAIPIQAKSKFKRDDKEVTETLSNFVEKAMKNQWIQIVKTKKKGGTGGYHGIVLVPNVIERTPAYVEEVEPNSPAAKAGLRPDDLIVYVDGDLVTIKIFREMVAQTQPNDEVVLEIQRGKKLMTVKLKLGQHPK
jgi:serine protease Do